MDYGRFITQVNCQIGTSGECAMFWRVGLCLRRFLMGAYSRNRSAQGDGRNV